MVSGINWDNAGLPGPLGATFGSKRPREVFVRPARLPPPVRRLQKKASRVRFDLKIAPTSPGRVQLS